MNATRPGKFRRRSLATLVGLIAMHAQATRAAVPATALASTMRELDTQVFNAYNTCNLKVFAKFFSPTVEFYHDDGGATFDRKTVIANTRKFICGTVWRDGS